MAQGTDGEAFATSRQNFEEVVGFLGSSQAGAGRATPSSKSAFSRRDVNCSASSTRTTWTCAAWSKNHLTTSATKRG